MDLNQSRLVIETTRLLDGLSPDLHLDALEELISRDIKLARRIFKYVKKDGEPKTYNVWLGGYHDKIKTIKSVRQVTGLGLADSKDFVEGNDSVHLKTAGLLARNVSLEAANEIKRVFTDNHVSGAVLILKPDEPYPLDATRLRLF